MNSSYIFYFDSGTSNTRAYLLDDDLEIVCARKKGFGSKDSAIAGNNSGLIDGLWGLYQEVLDAASVKDSDISGIYASGMVTSPYGLREVPHVSTPISIRDFSEAVCPFEENTRFHRTIELIPGLKSMKEDFSFSGNMRGEEIEIFGAIDDLRESCPDSAVLILPGSHTHMALINDGAVEDIISTFTGELFHALQKETVLSPVLEGEIPKIDTQMVKLAYSNLTRFGFNRAIYIGHAMKVFERGSPAQWFSYCEGAINGGVRQVLEYYCGRFWKSCETAAIVSDEFMYRLFAALFEDSEHIKRVVWLPINSDSIYSVKGLKKILKILKTNRGK